MHLKNGSEFKTLPTAMRSEKHTKTVGILTNICPVLETTYFSAATGEASLGVVARN
jgi:hypothetical protein